MATEPSIKAYDQLADLYQDERVGTPFEQDADFTVHRMEAVHTHPVRSPVFRANYFSFVLIKEGKSWYSIDHHTFHTKPRTLYFTNPGHLKSFGIEKVVHGFLITLSEQYLKQHVHSSVFDDFDFLLTETVPPCFLSTSRFDELHQLAEQMQHENAKKTALRHKIISSLFVVFLLKVKDFLMKDHSFRVAYDRNSEIVDHFKKDLERVFRSDSIQTGELQVTSFADRQQLHPAYFSTVIRAKTAKTAHLWIQEKILTEAQAMLTRASTPVKEVAYRLGFSEPTHFSKFFKKHTQLTPNQYRKQRLT